jgi:hypothetical protein
MIFIYVKVGNQRRALWHLQVDPDEEPPPAAWVVHVESPYVFPDQVDVIGIFWNFTDQP